jgi:monolysocardiolipin acyltransferase
LPRYPENPLPPESREAILRFEAEPTPWRRIAARAVAAASRVLMRRLNTLEVLHGERLAGARSRGRGLLTFSNHVSLFDDPWLTACVADGPWEELRWVAADSRNFFGSAWKGALFNAGKCVPLVRGAGLEQPGMAFLEQRLHQGDWVHVYPEGGRTREPDAALKRPLKAGLAHLVRATRPLLLPFVHRGMHEVLPIGAWLPRTGKQVQLVFGELEDSAQGLASGDLTTITAWAEDRLVALSALLEERHPSSNSSTRVNCPQEPQRISRSSQEFPFG